MSAIRLGLALAGFAAALLSIAFESRRMGWIAIGLLVGSLIIRVILGRPKRD